MRTPIQLQELVERFSNADLSLPVRRGYAVPEFGPIISEPQETIQIRNPRAVSDALSVTGSFFHMYVDSVTGDTMLQGGTITGGSDTDTIADIAVIDSGTGLPTQSAGVHMYADITGSGTTADGVLIPGWTQTATAIAYAATVPSNTLPTAASPTGKKVYVDLGVFTADNFFPAAPGSITVTHCPGAYSISR